MTFRIVSRKEAGLALPRKFSGWMKLPAPEVWVHHTVTSEFLDDPAAGARRIQQIAFERGFYDISYSFLIFNDGTIIEGRGWGVVGAHTSGHNAVSHGLSFVGNYETGEPTDTALAAAAWLIDEGIRLGKMSPPRSERPNGGHRDLASTACPGRNVYNQLYILRHTPAVDPPPASEEDEMLILNPGDGKLYLLTSRGVAHIVTEKAFWSLAKSVRVADVDPETFKNIVGAG